MELIPNLKLIECYLGPPSEAEVSGLPNAAVGTSSVLLLSDSAKDKQVVPAGTPSVLRTHLYLPSFPNIAQGPLVPACGSVHVRLSWYLTFPDPLFRFRIWNPSTPTSRTHSLTSTHRLRPRRPRCSGRCSAWLRGSTEAMGCAASLTSSSLPRGPCSTCSRKPV